MNSCTPGEPLGVRDSAVFSQSAIAKRGRASAPGGNRVSSGGRPPWSSRNSRSISLVLLVGPGLFVRLAASRRSNRVGRELADPGSTLGPPAMKAP